MDLFKRITLGVISLSLLACASFNGPRDSVSFRQITSLSELDGLYQNRPNTGQECDIYSPSLSKLIWPDNAISNHFHQQVIAVKVKAEDNETLLVTAHGRQGILKTSRFKQGKDFNFKDGRIRFSITGIHSEKGSPGLGLETKVIELGIDQKGRGKYRRDEAFLGTLFIFFPAAFIDTKDMYFKPVDASLLKKNGGIEFTPLPNNTGYIFGRVTVYNERKDGSRENESRRKHWLLLSKIENNQAATISPFTHVFPGNSGAESARYPFQNCLPVGDYAFQYIKPGRRPIDIRFQVLPDQSTYIGDFDIVLGKDSHRVIIHDRYDTTRRAYKEHYYDDTFPVGRHLASQAGQTTSTLHSKKGSGQ